MSSKKLKMEEKVYVSLSSYEHKANRSEILMAQADILHILKRLSKIERIKREKDIYKTKLIRQFTLLLKNIDKLETKIPEPKVPKNFREHKEKTKEEPKEAFQGDGIDVGAVENELLSVQEQLKSLNG